MELCAFINCVNNNQISRQVVHDVRLYSVLDTVVIPGDDVCYSVVFGILVGVFVFSVMWSELLMTVAMWSSVYKCQSVECAFTSPVRTDCGMFVVYYMQYCMSVSAVLCCMCVVNKHFELLEFVFGSVYVDLQYDETSLISTAWSVSLWCVCSHVVIFGLSVKLLWYPMWMRWLL